MLLSRYSLQLKSILFAFYIPSFPYWFLQPLIISKFFRFLFLTYVSSQPMFKFLLRCRICSEKIYLLLFLQFLFILIVLISFPFLFESFMIFCSFTFFRFSCLHWFHYHYLLKNIVIFISREIGLTLVENTKFCACILFCFSFKFFCHVWFCFDFIPFRLFLSLFSFDFVSFLSLFLYFLLI